MPACVHALLLDGLQAPGGVTAHGSGASRQSWGWQRAATTVWLSFQINLGASEALRYLLLLRVLLRQRERSITQSLGAPRRSVSHPPAGPTAAPRLLTSLMTQG